KPKLLLMGNPAMPDAKIWPPLADTEQEVKWIAQNVNQKKSAGFQAKGALPLQALPLVKAEATEANFRQIAGIQNYLHLATHGYVVSDPLRSGLVLAKTGKTMETDGVLTTAEIFGLPLNAELVVLSACQTGLGQISSDGVAGLSRAFLYAGASSLIVSLWKVSDAATQHLMVKFYEELARDGDKARALRAAQLTTMKKYPYPRDWAAFVLVGQPK
ncbi:MAG: CHAT domain-containing protein, partial [bacterium]